MKTVTILGFDQALATTITGAADIYGLAGVIWQRIQGEPISPQFSVRFATPDGQPIECANGIRLSADCCAADVQETDLLIIPTIVGRIDTTLASLAPLFPWLHRLHQQGTDIASNDTGAFILAEAGILDNKLATTHWGFTELFRHRYPKVNLQPAQLITADENVYCSGGGMAWLDLAIFLIERYCGPELALQTAKSFVFDFGRQDQSVYSAIPNKKYHQDEDILKVQNWMENNLEKNIHLDRLAEQFHMSPRTFKRRFKQATGETALEHLQKLRIDAAKRALESKRFTVEVIAGMVGYQDQSAFSKLFKRETGLTPGAFRSKFGIHVRK